MGLFITLWMTLVASLAVVLIPPDFIVFVSQLTGIVMLVAINATELAEITGYGVTLNAVIPLALVLSTENREIKIVMVLEVLCRPSGLYGVTSGAIRRKAIGLVIG